MKKTLLFDDRGNGGRARPRLLAICLTGFVAGALSYGCSDEAPEEDEGPPPTGTVTLDVSYKNELDETATDSLHAWVLSPKEGEGLNCSDLIAGEADPYDGAVSRRADVVLSDLDQALEFDSEVGDGLLYVEGVDFSGEAHIAGCTEIDVKKGGASGSVSLVRAGVFDCDDPDTEDGSPCDDGEFCTVGETCDGGSCTGGEARDCSGGATDCSAGTCSEEEGCVLTPQPDDTPCDDGSNCTTNDACQSGQCVGTAVDCSGQAGVCETGGVCDESTGTCVFTDATLGTACDDGEFCTVSSECSSLGSCSYNVSNRVCLTSDCVTFNSCNETSDSCNPTYATNGTGCDDNPCIDIVDGADSAECDGAGHCDLGTGGANSYTDSGTTCEVGCREGTCDGAGNCNLTTDLTNGTSCDDGFGTCQDGLCTN